MKSTSWYCVLVLFLAGSHANAADEPQKEDSNASTAEKQAEDPYAVPDGDVAELLEFIQKTEQSRPRLRTRDEFNQHIKTSRAAIIKAADIVLGGSPKDSEAVTAVKAKFAALEMLARVGDPHAADKTKEFATSLKDDSRAGIQELVAFELLKVRVADIASLKLKQDKTTLLEDVAAQLKQAGVDRENFAVAMNAARAFERGGDTDLAIAAYKQFAELIKTAKDDRLHQYSAKMEGSARRLGLPGKPIEIFGRTVDGDPFEIEQHKGKVVLVDFWATWCGPCIVELPNVKKQYEKYHKHGFEVVGVSLDSNKGRLDAFIAQRDIPWTNLFSEEPDKTGWEHPMATRYGIMAIPATILVDRKGNVISLSARGKQLGKLLEEAIGPVESASDANDSKESKAGK